MAFIPPKIPLTEKGFRWLSEINTKEFKETIMDTPTIQQQLIAEKLASEVDNEIMMAVGVDVAKGTDNSGTIVLEKKSARAFAKERLEWLKEEKGEEVAFQETMKQFFTRSTEEKQQDTLEYFSAVSERWSGSYSMSEEAEQRYQELEALANLCRDLGLQSVEEAKRFLEGKVVERKQQKERERTKVKEARKDRQILV